MQYFLTLNVNFFLFGLTGQRIYRNHNALPHTLFANDKLCVVSYVNTC